MPTFRIRKNGRVYSKTADTREEAVEAVLAADAEFQRTALGAADSQLDAMDGPQVAPREKSEIETTFSDYLDAAGAMISGTGGAIVGNTFGLAKGLKEAVQDGTYGTAEGVSTVKRNVDETTDQFSRDVYTEGGAQVLNNVAGVMEPFTDPTKLGFVAGLPGMGPVATYPGMFTRQAVRASGTDFVDAARATGEVVANAGKATGKAALSPVTVPARAIKRNIWEPEANRKSVGAAETEKARERQATSQNLPVPFGEETQLTRGQLTRDFDQLQFEREAAKAPVVGQGLRERYQSQQALMHQNFDAMDEDIGGPAGFYDDIEQGSQVREAVTNYRAARKKQKDDAYKLAEQAGETNALVNPARMPEEMQRLWHDQGIVPKNKAMIEEAQRLNIIDEQGRMKPTTVHNLVKLREFANRGYNAADPTEMYQRRQLINAIDEALNSTDAGPVYTQARKIATEYYDEFDNSPLASGIAKNKRGSNVEQIASEKIVSRVTGSSVQEIQQLQRTLNATPEGQTQWKGIQSRFLQDIRDKAFGTQTDSNGTPLLSPATFKRHVTALDRSGKLEAMLGPKQAQQIRDMVEVAEAIGTAPPGAINHSNTSSAIMNALNGMLGMANPKNALIGHFYTGARDSVKAAKSLDGQSLLEGL